MSLNLHGFFFTCPGLDTDEVMDFLTSIMSDYGCCGGYNGSFHVATAKAGELPKLISAVRGHYPKAKIELEKK